ncbi:MAG: hypothetical protein EON96_00150 [Caulobacteraceae bacterium]|nr:MAG: hypothetical protein EON96_00150 [Caulobacteraceae bacterium]
MLLTFDAETGSPVTDRSYNDFVAQVIGQLDVTAGATAAVTASRDLSLAAVASVQATALASVDSAKVLAVAEIGSAAANHANALGIVSGSLFDTVPLSAGFDGGFAITDVNGWTTAEKYFRQAGVPGPVIRARTPGVDWSGETDAFQIAVLPVMPSAFRVYLNAADALTNGAVLPNRLTSDPTNIDENIILYDTGYMKNQGAGSAPIMGLDGEWVTWRASSASDIFSWWSGDLPPAGNYGIRFEVRSEPTFGTQNVRYGNTAALQALTVTEAPQTIEFDFAATGTGTNYSNFGIRGDGANSPRIQLRRIILKEGVAAAALPAWSALRRGSGDARKEIAWPGGLPKSGNFLDNTSNLARVAFRDPDYTTGNHYRNVDGVTLIVAAQLEIGGTAASAIGVDVNTVAGTTTTSLGIGSGANSMVSHNPGTLGVGPSGWLLAAIEDQGIQFLCLRIQDGEQIASLAEIDFNWDADSWPGISANVWRLAGLSTASTWKGKIRAAAIAFSFISEADKIAAIAKMAHDMANEGDTVASFDFAMIYGDSRLSNAIPAGTKLIAQVSSAGHYAAEPNLFTYQFATGGETLATFQATDLPKMLTMARQITYRGRKGIVSGLLGTNDSGAMIANPATYEAQQRSTIWNPLGAIPDSENLYFAPFNETARYTAGWNAAVSTYAALLASKAGRSSDPTKAYHDIVDSQSSAVGASNAANFATYFLENPNYVHPNALGNSAMVPQFDAMVGRFRAWKAA